MLITRAIQPYTNAQLDIKCIYFLIIGHSSAYTKTYTTNIHQITINNYSFTLDTRF